MPTQRLYSQMDLSGGVQVRTSHLLQDKKEVDSAINACFDKVIGSAKRRNGYEKVARTIEHGKDSLGACIYNYDVNHKIVVGINRDDDSYATLRVLDKDDYYTSIITDASANTKFDFCNFLEELYVSGLSDSGVYFSTANIDSTLVPSYTRNLIGAPDSEFITDYNGSLYALNCKVGDKIYRDRAYFSSPPLGAITYVQGDQSGLKQQLLVDATHYLKAGMQIDIYGAGTEAQKVSSLTIVSVDKANKTISFTPTQINVKDNDELWLVGRKGKLSLYWNTDDPTPEASDYLLLPPGRDIFPKYTGYGNSNSRLFMFSRNSMVKWDGSTLSVISDTIGCVAQRTVQNIGDWLLWLHSSGVWGYNDKTGQLKLLSRGMDKWIKAINQRNYPHCSAGVIDDVYKLAVGEIAKLDTGTTSTSTSSTSTSSTSSSTSSTSTSSTSTSSTSTSGTFTTTSTSSTSMSSTSTSVTTFSTSTSSTSTSFSTSSTSTSTAISIKKCVRLCYDFNMNTWWTEKHKREMRVQFLHTMHGYTKLYFTDETGRLFRDDTTNTDNGEAIPFEVELGRSNMGIEQTKNFLSVKVDSEAARGLIVQYAIDGGQYKTLGQVTKDVETLSFPQGGQNIEGIDISYKFVHNDTGDPPILNGIVTYFSVAERIVYER